LRKESALEQLEKKVVIEVDHVYMRYNMPKEKIESIKQYKFSKCYVYFIKMKEDDQ
jgi:hypothetical protein